MKLGQGGPSIFFLRELVDPIAPILEAMTSQNDSRPIAEVVPRTTGPREGTECRKAWFLGGSLVSVPDEGARSRDL